MRSPLAEVFYDTLTFCFGKVLVETLGPKVQASVYDLIERGGIRRADISNRFDDVVQVLTSTALSILRLLFVDSFGHL